MSDYTFMGKPINRLPYCDCGHPLKFHYGAGWCYGHDKPGTGRAKCGCTWYHPNAKWIAKQHAKRKEQIRRTGKW